MSGIIKSNMSVRGDGYDFDYDIDLCLCVGIDSTKSRDMWLEANTCFSASLVAGTFQNIPNVLEAF